MFRSHVEKRGLTNVTKSEKGKTKQCLSRTQNCGGKTRVTPMKNSQDYLMLSGTLVTIQHEAPMGVFELVEKVAFKKD
mgnify:CR=1 FL=1